MTLIPVTGIARLAATAWFLVCSAVLVFAIVNRGNHETDFFVLILLIVLCLPVSVALVGVIIAVFYVLLEFGGIEIPGGLGTNVVFWLLFVLAGYWQWRVVAPRQFGK